MAGFAGALAGLGNEGAQLEQARQRRITESLAAAQEKRSQSEEARRQRLSDIQTRQMQTGQPLGEPFRASDGKVYQRFLDPNTGQLIAREVTEPQEESTVGKVMRQLREAEASGVVIPPEMKQRIVEAALGGKAALPSQAQAKTGPWRPTGQNDPESGLPMFERDVIDPITRAPTGNKEYTTTPWASVLPQVSTGDAPATVSTPQGDKIVRVPVTRMTQRRLPTGGTTAPRATTPSKRGGSTSTNTTDLGLPRGTRIVGDAPMKSIENAAVQGASKIKPMVDLLDATEDYYKSGRYTPRQDLALIVRAVRAMNPGSVRLPIKELELELKAGSYGDRFRRWFETATTGLLPSDQRADLMGVIKSETETTARSAAATWKQSIPGRPLPPYLKRFDTGDSDVIVVKPEDMR